MQFVPVRSALPSLIALAVILAGCTGAAPQASESSPDTTSENRYVRNDSLVFDYGGGPQIVDGGITYRTDYEGVTEYATRINTRNATRRFNFSVINSEAATFVNETNFENATLVVYQQFPSSSYPRVWVERVTYDGTHISIRLRNSNMGKENAGGTGDLVLKTVFVRVYSSNRSAPIVIRYGDGDVKVEATRSGMNVTVD
jgi:hypothetical protein